MRVRSFLVAATVVAAAVAACAPAAARRTAALPPLDDEVAREIAAGEGVPWSSTRPLKWDDFQAMPPSTGQVGALTVYSLFRGVRCTGNRFQFKVVAAFLPRSSWVKPIVLSDASRRTRTLRHEQTHFDLAEVYARRLRQHFTGLAQPCSGQQEALGAAADRFTRDEAAAQRRYDDETRHGLALDPQRKWDVDVDGMLKTLVRFGAD